MSWGDARPQTAAAGSRWITNPKHLPVISANSSTINIKSGPTTNTQFGLAAAFTALALRGAVASISVANTYVTVANLTGAGFLFHCVSPTHSAAATPSIRLTVDGTVYTLTPSAAQTLGYRLVLGALTHGSPSPNSATAATAADVIAPNSAADFGFNGSAVGNVISQGQATGLIPPELILSLGLACLRFESSLLIEMKCDLLSGTAVDKQCGASYRLDM